MSIHVLPATQRHWSRQLIALLAVCTLLGGWLPQQAAAATTASGTFVQDTFTGAAGTPLEKHTTDSGASWVRASGSADSLALSAAGRLRAINYTGLYYSSAAPSGAEYDVTADLVAISTDQSYLAGLMARLNPATGAISRGVYDTGYKVWQLGRVNADGTTTSLGMSGSSGSYPLASGASYHLRLSVRDAAKQLWVQGPTDASYVKVLDSSDNALTAAGRVGLTLDHGSETSGLRLDNFAASLPATSASAPTTSSVVQDTFTGAAGTPLEKHTTDSGASWVRASGSADSLALSAAGRLRAINYTGLYYSSAAPSGAEYDVTADLVAISTDQSYLAGLMARFDPATGASYRAVYDTGYKVWQLDRVNADGTTTSLGMSGSSGSYPLASGASYHLRLSVRDAAKQLWVQGPTDASYVKVLDSSDNALTAAGRVGLTLDHGSETSGLRLDNFAASLPATSASAPTTSSVVQDTFTGAAGTPLEKHTTDSGASWVRASGSADSLALSAAGRLRAINYTGLYYSSAAPSGAEYDVTADLVAVSTDQSYLAGLMARFDPATGASYRAVYDTGYKVWQLDRVNADGTTTSLGMSGSSGSYPLASGASYHLKLSVRNTAKQLWVQGPTDASYVKVLDSSDNALPAAGRVGLTLNHGSETSGLHVDNFGAMLATSAPAPTTSSVVQ